MSASPTSMEQLSAMLASGQYGAIQPWPTPSVPAMASGVTIDQVRALITESLNAYTVKQDAAPSAPAPDLSKLQNLIAQTESVFQRALPEEDYKAFQAYVQAGGQGFGDVLKSDALHPIVQLLWETIKENTK